MKRGHRRERSEEIFLLFIVLFSKRFHQKAKGNQLYFFLKNQSVFVEHSTRKGYTALPRAS